MLLLTPVPFISLSSLELGRGGEGYEEEPLWQEAFGLREIGLYAAEGRHGVVCIVVGTSGVEGDVNRGNMSVRGAAPRHS